MDSLKIKLDPYKKKNVISLNGKPFASYSAFTNFINSDFLSWADSLFEIASGEINSDYSLAVIGEKFEKEFIRDLIKALRKKSEEDQSGAVDSCKGYEPHDFNDGKKPFERLKILGELANGHSIPIEDKRLCACCDITLPEEIQNLINVVDMDAASFVFTEESSVSDYRYQKNLKLIIASSDEDGVLSIGNGRYIWKVCPERMIGIVAAVAERYSIVPTINFISEKLNEIHLWPNELETVALATETEALLDVKIPDTIEAGQEVIAEIFAIPKDSVIPDIRLESSNNEILSVKDLTVTGLVQGKTRLDFYRAEEATPFASRDITVIRNYYVKNITIELSDNKMKIGGIQRATAKIVPADAEDANNIRWASDSDSVTIHADGSITGVKPGTAVIKAFSERAEAETVVTVLPNISSITLSENDISLSVGKTKEISAKVEPATCFDKRCCWESNNSMVAIVETSESGRSIVKATGVGSCVLMCKALEGDANAACRVEVTATSKATSKGNSAVGGALVCMIAAISCSILSIKIGVLIAAVGAIVLSFIAVARNKKDAWVLLFAVVSALLAYNSI